MTRGWSDHPEAREELHVAARYYESRESGLGDRFTDAAEAAVESILDPSIGWGFYRGRRSKPQIYSRSITGFPIDLVYVVLDERVFVLAYAHERRRPDYWRHRLSR